MMTIGKPSCYDRPPFDETRRVQDGWLNAEVNGVLTRIPRMVMIYDEMSKGCQQWGPLGEARLKSWDCDGCKWKETK